VIIRESGWFFGRIDYAEVSRRRSGKKFGRLTIKESERNEFVRKGIVIAVEQRNPRST